MGHRTQSSCCRARSRAPRQAMQRDVPWLRPRQGGTLDAGTEKVLGRGRAGGARGRRAAPAARDRRDRYSRVRAWRSAPSFVHGGSDPVAPPAVGMVPTGATTVFERILNTRALVGVLGLAPSSRPENRAGTEFQPRCRRDSFMKCSSRGPVHVHHGAYDPRWTSGNRPNVDRANPAKAEPPRPEWL